MGSRTRSHFTRFFTHTLLNNCLHLWSRSASVLHVVANSFLKRKKNHDNSKKVRYTLRPKSNNHTNTLKKKHSLNARGERRNQNVDWIKQKKNNKKLKTNLCIPVVTSLFMNLCNTNIFKTHHHPSSWSPSDPEMRFGFYFSFASLCSFASTQCLATNYNQCCY